MLPKKLDERAIKTCVANRANPYDFPKITSGCQAEEYAYSDHPNVAAHSGILKLHLSFQCFLYDKRYAVIRRNSHIRHDVKGYAQSCEQTAGCKKQNP